MQDRFDISILSRKTLAKREDANHIKQTMSKDTYRLLVVDDHAIVRHGLAVLLESSTGFEICGEAGSVEEARTALGSLKPDILIIDITLRDGSGLELVPIALEANPAMRILVLSMHDEADYALRALRAGAHGYVMKENADEVITEALERVAAGEIYVSPAISARVMREWAGGGAVSGAENAGGVAALTERERQVFEAIGRGLTSKKIAEEFGLSARTVEVHRAHIKKKLGCEDAAQLFREAVRWVEGAG